MQKLTMEEFISTTISSKDKWPCSSKPDSICKILRESHITPWVEWEILHPQLPILKITAHADQTLPLAPAGLEKIRQDDPLRNRSESSTISNMSTKYSVSFVISLQNRWASFDDPNRWIIRFKDNFYYTKPWELDPGLPYPNYWDDTGYMQHRIIGPVVLTIHEYETEDGAIPVLKPGNYSRAPSTTTGKPPDTPDRRANADPRRTQGAQPRIRTDDLRGMAEPEQTQRRVPAPGTCTHRTQPGTGDEDMEEFGMEGHDW